MTDYENISLEELTNLQQSLKQMVASAAWKYYCDVVAGQKQTRLNQVMLKPCSGMDGTLEQEYLKGEYQGFSTAIALAEELISGCDLTLERLRQEAEDSKEMKDE